MSKRTIRSIGTQVASATAGAVIAVVLVGSGFAVAQEAPEAGTGVAEALAGANTVNSAAIINSTITGSDVANGTLGRNELKPNVVARWAKVNGGGAGDTELMRGRGVESAFRGATAGVYRVAFTESVANCGWTATINDNSNGTAAPLEITVETSKASPTDLVVRTFNSAGTPADTAPTDGFTVNVDC